MKSKRLQIITPLYIESVPKGGTTGQVLMKISDEDYDVEWKDIKSEIEKESLSLLTETGLVEVAGDETDGAYIDENGAIFIL